MTYRTALVHLGAYPDETPPEVIDQAAALCRAVAQAAVAAAVHIDIPQTSNWIAESVLNLTQVAQEEEARSRRSADAAIERFLARAADLGLPAEPAPYRATISDMAASLTRMARTRDISIVPFGPRENALERELAESLIFGSGRPVLVAPPGAMEAAPPRRLAIAWDGSRSAARAVADALPLLAGGGAVQVLSAINEKPSVVAGGGGDLVRYLASHGISGSLHEIEAGDTTAAKALRDHLATEGVDLLVMGAFGHSRLREFVLGGVTADFLAQPPARLLLSH